MVSVSIIVTGLTALVGRAMHIPGRGRRVTGDSFEPGVPFPELVLPGLEDWP
ncbi:hypothetical protein GCM10027033_29180 [Leucobacter ruminantium]